MPVVTRVHREPAPTGTHDHVTAVLTEKGSYHTLKHVLEGLKTAEVWHTRAGGQEARILSVPYCTVRGCDRENYIHVYVEPSAPTHLDTMPTF
jgi:hypothetical protein